MAKSGCAIEGCEEPWYCRGWCRRHYKRWLQSIAPECAVDGCEKPVYCRVWCLAHYKLWHRRGDPEAPTLPNGSALNAMKTRCPRGHPYSEKNTRRRQNPRTGGFQRWCKACEAGRDRGSVTF